MLMRDNFEDFVKSLDDSKKELCRDFVDQKEFIYIAFSSYGDILEFIPTNDNNGIYMAELQSDEWDGNSYLIQISEIIEIIGE
jgi:hypothetical protein